MKYCIAIDIGASSGRHIVGWQENGQIRTDEVYRFSNGVKELDGHLIWNMDALEKHVRAGIDAALQRYPRIDSLSIDIWGVDYVLLKDDEPVLPCYAYRDSRMERSSVRYTRKCPSRSCTSGRASSSSRSIPSTSSMPTSWPDGWRGSQTS